MDVFKTALCATLLLSAVYCTPTGQITKYKICVAEVNLPACEQLAKENGLKFTCVSARDRLECIDKVQQHQADIVPADPEDIYIAAQIPEEHFTVFKEIRTKEEPTEEFRYEAVAVIHKDLQIDSVQGIRGLRSCHTGVGRNVGYKIPITKLTKWGVLGLNPDATISARQNELRALSLLFTKACLVGKWSADPVINSQLKSTYSNLCQLCEDPEKCDYPDKFSGYDGALRCLCDNGGQVAWTKVYYVKKHFGIPIGTDAPYTVTNQTGYNPDDYAYLCPNGTKTPITGRACRWAARPWQGFLANADLSSNVDQLSDLRAQLSLASTRGQETNAAWLQDVLLELKNKTTVVDAPSPPISPEAYLVKSNYSDVIERGAGTGYLKIRFCVTSEVELAKCRSLHRAAFSRDIRPEFDCVLQSSQEACLPKIEGGEADIISLSAENVLNAESQYSLKPIISEAYGDNANGTVYYSVAVVKKSSSYSSLAELRGAKSCHPGYGVTGGWKVPLYRLLKLSLLSASTCPHAKALSDFFSGGSCVPGARSAENNPSGENPAKLCEICAGSQDSKCEASPEEAFYGYGGAFRCLASGAGNVAFVIHSTVAENTDGKNSASWAVDLKSSDFELLCPDGTRKSVDQYASCHLGAVPGHKVVTSSNKTLSEIDAIRHAVVSAGKLYHNRPELFRLFGPYHNKHNLLFKDLATGFVSISGNSEVDDSFAQIIEHLKTCGSN